MTDREIAETALERLRTDTCSEDEPWPPVARRVREARERLGWPLAQVAARLGMQTPEYWDIEFHDDEAYTCVSLAHLRQLAQLLEVPLEILLFGSDFERPPTRTSFATVAAGLRSLADRNGLTIEALGEQVGWELSPVMADPESLAHFNLAGLSDLCHAIGVDWVTVL